MSNTSRTNASDSDKMPTRKQIAALFKAWADGNAVTVYREHVELFGERPEDQAEEDKSTPVPLDGMILTLMRIGSGLIDREKLQAFLRKGQRQRPSLFGEFKIVTIPATAEPFITLEHFRKVCSLGENFCDRFLFTHEEPRGELTLRYGVLKRSSADRQIIVELGGEQVIEVSTSAIHWLILQQANGEDGVLLTNGCSNVFYVRDDHAALCAVRVYWSNNGWHVSVYGVGYPYPWLGGHQVIFRN